MPETPETVPAASATDELVAKLAAEIRNAAPAPTQVSPVSPTREAILKRLDDAGKEGAGKFAEELANTVLMPMQAGNIRVAAQLQRRSVERDPELGKLYKRYKKQVEARASELGGDAYIAERGLDSVVRSVAAEDPAYVDELAETRADEKVAKRDAEAKVKADADAATAAAATPKRAPTETVHAGYVPTPSAPEATEEEEIRRIEVSDEDVTLGRTLFRMTPTDIKKQRHEIAKMERKFGPIGIKQLGGVPIVDLASCRTQHGPYPTEED